MTDWIERLRPGELPVFKRTKAVVTAMSDRREAITARQLAAEVLADPLASYQLLHTINKKVGERYGTEVTTVEHGLMMQGIGAYIDAARKLSVLEDTTAARDPYVVRKLHALTRRAQHAAWQARDFAVLHADVHAEEVQVAALLYYLPEFLLLLRAPELAPRWYRARRRMGATAADQAVLGTTLDTLRPALLAEWQIPPTSRELLVMASGERPRQCIVSACVDIAERSERGWWDEALVTDYIALAGVENTPVETIIATVHANAARVARACDWIAAPPAATWCPMLPGPWPPDEDDMDEAATQRPAPSPPPTEPAAATAPPAAPAAPAPPSPPATPAASSAPAPSAACPVPDKQVFQQSLKNIEAHLDGSYTINQMSAVILKGLHSGLGLARILFAMVTPDGTRVKTRFTLGVASDDPLRHFEFPLAGKDLFAQLMGKMQGVWLNDGNRAKLLPMIAPHLRPLVGDNEFFAMSLHQGDRPIALIYADRGRDGSALDSLTYTDFKMLCLQAARGLAKVKS